MNIAENFIVFEGIDGAGTTTQLKKLAEKLGEKAYVSAEPTKGETGLFLRKMLKGDFKVSEKTASYLFAADRCEHIYGKDGILEQTAAGKIALSDRYFFSSLAYQTISCGKEIPELVNSPFPLPQLLFYFRIDPEISFARVTSRGEAKEIYEKLEMQKKIAALYDSVMEKYKGDAGKGMTLVEVDARLSIEEIASFIWQKTREVLHLQ